MEYITINVKVFRMVNIYIYIAIENGIYLEW